MLDTNSQNTLLNHGFKYISMLGKGGFGEVVKVKHLISNQFYAVKKLINGKHRNNINILREIQTISKIENPNIINYKYSFIEDNELYLVMEYCPRGSLYDLLKKKRKLDIEYATNLVLRLTHTLSLLHNQGFIHHDIKPANILFTEEKVKITDFGTVNTKIGTIVYSAPEMLIGNASIDDPRVDIFSLGLTFMECLSGVNPLSKTSSINEQCLLVKNANYPINVLPYWIQQLLLKACHYNPNSRFQTMLEFHNAILRRHIPQVITEHRLNSEKQIAKLKMLLVGRKWNKARKFIELHDNNAIGFLIQKGKYNLSINNLTLAKDCFEKVLIKDRNAPIEKQIAEIYLQHNEPSKAATILQGYINNHFYDVEAHNQLLFSYFLSDQWELGVEQADFLIKQFPKELLIFQNNKNIFNLLLGNEIDDNDIPTKRNAIGHYNYNVVNDNTPLSFEPNNKTILKSKLLFYEYRFKNLIKGSNTITIEINNTVNECNDYIITFGRKGYDYNTFSSFDDNRVSRRHFVIMNQKNNVWLYDISTLGTKIDGKKVNRIAFLLGRHSISFGNQEIIIKSDSNLLL